MNLLYHLPHTLFYVYYNYLPWFDHQYNMLTNLQHRQISEL